MSLFCLEKLFADFIKEKTFLADLSIHTLRSYKLSFAKFTKYASELNKSGLNDFVIGMRQEGLKVGGCNVKIRSMNSFLSWCFENDYTDEHLKIKLLKMSQPVLKVFSDAHIKALLRFKPKGAYEYRLWAITCLLIDTGSRISEILELKINDVNYNDFLITIKGHTFIVESKSLQTNSIKKTDNGYIGKAQCDASDRRTVNLPDGSQIETTLLLYGEFDILSVNIFAFEEDWRFVYTKNQDLPHSNSNKYTEAQREHLIASLVTVNYPIKAPFTEDLTELLDEIIEEREAGEAPKPLVIERHGAGQPTLEFDVPKGD